MGRYDSIILDLVGQTLAAKADGWEWTAPARYSALLTGLTEALAFRHAQRPGMPAPDEDANP